MKTVGVAGTLQESALSLSASRERAALRLLDSGQIIAGADNVIVHRDCLFGLPRVAPKQR